MAAVNALQPTDRLRRSFVYRILQANGAVFEEINGGAVAMRFGASTESEVAKARRLGLADLSPLPRTGFKGVGTVDWLTAQGLTIGPDSNRAYRQSGGELAARLAPTEVLLLDSLSGDGALIERLNGAWGWSTETPRKPIGYPMPRADSHCWFAVTGEQAPAMFAKICGVDLRPNKFPEGAIAQTSVARINGIVIRQATALPSYYLLADSASAEYLWHGVMDAMLEFDGGPVGLAAVRELSSGV
ncbi:sarcosine oxidase [Rhodospirillaceae bacterium SYSU D60014]|uniref:sarcosine oxidase n=1 Tax=Virgifigura deserti TaxID=2268457 RepID=UPI000E6702B6